VSWTQVPLPDQLRAIWADNMPGQPLPRAFEHRAGLGAIVGREPLVPPDGDLRWHVSVRGKGRVPSWEQLVDAAHELRPGVAFAVGVPPRSWWMNVHPHVLHLWEVTDQNLLRQWQAERRGDIPT
jgi:hypothetical protein